MSASIHIRNVDKSYLTDDIATPVLHGITMTVPKGELAMLMGPSGCGKTTLISIVCGILSADTGEVQINGTSVTHLKDNDKVLFRRKNVGFIFQQFNLITNLTALENAAVPLIVAGMRFDESLAQAREIFKKIGIEDQAHKLPSHLSGGQQQRVAIARALVHRPSIIVCDEPTSALDATTGYNVMAMLKEQAQHYDTTLIVVTHDSRITEFADRIFTMDDGRIIAEQTTRDSLS